MIRFPVNNSEWGIRESIDANAKKNSSINIQERMRA